MYWPGAIQSTRLPAGPLALPLTCTTVMPFAWIFAAAASNASHVVSEAGSTPASRSTSALYRIPAMSVSTGSA